MLLQDKIYASNMIHSKFVSTCDEYISTKSFIIKNMHLKYYKVIGMILMNLKQTSYIET